MKPLKLCAMNGIPKVSNIIPMFTQCHLQLPVPHSFMYSLLPMNPSAVFHFPKVLFSLLLDDYPSKMHCSYARQQRHTLLCGCARTLTDTNIPSVLPQSLPTVFQRFDGPSYSTSLRKAPRLHRSQDFQADMAYLRSIIIT